MTESITRNMTKWIGFGAENRSVWDCRKIHRIPSDCTDARPPGLNPTWVKLTVA